MTDWADEIASRVVGDVAAIAAALRSEDLLRKQIAEQADADRAELRAEIERLAKTLASERRVSIDRLKTIKGMKRKVRG